MEKPRSPKDTATGLSSITPLKTRFEKKGLVISGILHNNSLCEITEVKDHPWMVGVQFHPEFKSKPGQPHPLFRDFIEAALNYKKSHG